MQKMKFSPWRDLISVLFCPYLAMSNTDLIIYFYPGDNQSEAAML